MADNPVTTFLKWALPRLGKDWAGFQQVQGQVESRLLDRLQVLGLRSFSAYRDYLNAHPEEWARVDAMSRITVSRFYRDPAVFDALRDDLLPALAHEHQAHGHPRLRAWSIGAASGEEPYTLRILWRHALRDQFGGLSLHVIATEVQPHMRQRARRACYSHGSLRHLPDGWIDRAFRYHAAHDEGRHAEPYVLHPVYRRRVTWRPDDFRAAMPDGPFALICCRNLAFTYFDASLQRWTLRRLLGRLRPGGLLVLGAKETLPAGDWPLAVLGSSRSLYRKQR